MADTEAIRGLLQDGDKVIIPYVNPATKTNEGIVKVDDTLSNDSENPVQNKVINTALSGKQATLVSGTNIKTVNNTSVLGSGNIAVQPVINDLADIRDNATAGKNASETISGYGDIVTHDADEFMSSSTVIGNAEIEIQKNGTKVDSFTTNQSGNKKTINITVPTSASDVNALPSSTKYGSTIDVTLSTSDYKQTIVLKDQDGNTLSSKVVDFPVESMVVSGEFDSENKKIVLTLQNGNTTDIPVGDLISGLQTEITSTNKLDADFIEDTLTTKKLVTTAEKNTWNSKQDALSSTQISNIAKGGTALQPSDVDSALSTTSENPVQNKVITSALNDKADGSDVIKKDGGSNSQTISLSSGSGTTSLAVKSRSTSSSYISFSGSSAWLGSIGVNSSKKPVFYNGTGYTLATTDDIPDIATTVNASSTNAETVGAKLFYDTVGNIETLLQGV